MTADRYSRLRGVSVTELMIAIALMSILTSAIGSLASYVNRAIDSRQHFNLLRWELENAREQIGTWNADEVTKERILSLPFSPKLNDTFSNLAWQTDMETLEIDRLSLSPAITTIRLSITAEYRNQAIQPLELYFWVSPSQSWERASDNTTGQIEPVHDEKPAEQSSSNENASNEL